MTILRIRSEVGVARGVHDVDLHVAVLHGGVFGQDGDAALTLQVVGVHDALGHGLVFAERTALLEHLVHQGGLAMVDVGDDGDVAQFLILHAFIFLLIWQDRPAVCCRVAAGFITTYYTAK